MSVLSLEPFSKLQSAIMATAPPSEESTIVDNKLFKAICLHQILNPTHGGNRYYRIAILAILWMSIVVQITQLVGLYYAVNDLQRFAFTTTVVSNSFLSLSKAYVLVTNVDRLRDGLEAARYEFTSCGSRDQRTVRRARAALSTIVRTFTVFSYVTCFFWILNPLSAIGEFLPLTNADGTVSRYRVTIYNYWLPVSVTVYNTTTVWALTYAVEMIVCFFNVNTWLLFDSYVLTMCFTFKAHFCTLSASYATIGHLDTFRSLTLHASSTYTGFLNWKKDDNFIKTGNNNTLNCYDELVNHLQDNQRIIKKYDEFFEVIKPVILFQMIGGSYTVITLTFLTSLTYLMGFSIISIPVSKAFFGFLVLTIQLYLYCYVFNHIETEKSAVNFGLYSSNWTAMDLKFKKTLLLAMNMNSAHRRVMKVIPRSIINLELFAKVMNMSYSIVSVLLNSRAGK
ncbi:hypothetical protein AGLY_000774 [Aphis glycines]|uniref:Odorant receptor n=1 Tax=Aphis glycines TaxID=307491 RepID=A0A6G0U7Y1_APHGL|nr:hypothetical protein AGLY_000774 [Aphis glycines]